MNGLRRVVPPEHVEQAALVRWARLAAGQWPELRLLYAVPNGGHRDIRVARKLVAEGVQPGVPDLVLPVARGGYHALYLEMKRQGSGRLSPAQRVWHEALAAAGNCVRTAWGWDEARAALEWYLAQPATTGAAA